jgi:hypothetical protein
LGQVLGMVADPQANVQNAGPAAELDHIWVYIDRD